MSIHNLNCSWSTTSYSYTQNRILWYTNYFIKSTMSCVFPSFSSCSSNSNLIGDWEISHPYKTPNYSHEMLGSRKDRMDCVATNCWLTNMMWKTRSTYFNKGLKKCGLHRDVTEECKNTKLDTICNLILPQQKYFTSMQIYKIQYTIIGHFKANEIIHKPIQFYGLLNSSTVNPNTWCRWL